jgi:amidophosphoribosyltransferase
VLSSITHVSFRNLLETDKLKEYLDVEAHRHVNSDSDSEIMLSIFASQLLQTNKRRVDEDDLFTGLEKMCGAVS